MPWNSTSQWPWNSLQHGWGVSRMGSHSLISEGSPFPGSSSKQIQSGLLELFGSHPCSPGQDNSHMHDPCVPNSECIEKARTQFHSAFSRLLLEQRAVKLCCGFPPAPFVSGMEEPGKAHPAQGHSRESLSQCNWGRKRFFLLILQHRNTRKHPQQPGPRCPCRISVCRA